MRVLICSECYSQNLGDGFIAAAMTQMLEEMPGVTSVSLLDLSGRKHYSTDNGSALARPVSLLRRIHRLAYAGIPFYAAGLNLFTNRFLALRGARRDEILCALADKDLLVIGGGQLLRDTRLAFPSSLATIVEIAASVELPVAFFSVGAGDRWSLLGKRYFRKALTSENVQSIYCRDDRSALSVQCRIPALAGRVNTTFDAALGSATAEPDADGRGIGLCVMNPVTIRLTSSRHAFASAGVAVEFWSRLYQALSEQGEPVFLFTNGDNADQALANEVEKAIHKRAGEDKPDCVCPRPTRPEEMECQIRAFSSIVAFRLHANIAAYVNGVPSVALEWDDKLSQFMSYTGQPDRLVSTDGRISDIVQRVCAALELPTPTTPRLELAARIRADLSDACRIRPETDVQTPGERRLAFFVTEDWYFCSHRLPLAVAARDAGFKVFVITRETSHGNIIRSAGLTLVPVNLVRRSLNPLRELRFINTLRRIYSGIRPDLVHHVAMKPVIYGTIAARLAGVTAVVNALAGLGYLFSSESLKARFARPVLRIVLRELLTGRNQRLILQNPDDVEEFRRTRIASGNDVVLIQGSGVDTSEYVVSQAPSGPPMVLLASRLLWDKGVAEFVAAARTIRAAKPDVRFVLAGEPDDENPNAVSRQVVEDWVEEGVVEWIGKRDDMPEVLANSNIVCLPSYREGLPKVLIEAASCARPIVTTDTPGCREVVQDGLNGFLVPARDSERLTDAIDRLLEDADLRIRMGRAGRTLVEKRFALQIVIDETLGLYEAIA